MPMFTHASSKMHDPVRGKTLRLSWTDGPIRGTTDEHHFQDDGAVDWVTDQVCLVSYLSTTGDTLTVVLDFSEHSVTGVASNESHWEPVYGRFEEVA